MIITGGDRSVGAACDGEDVHAPCAVKLRGGSPVGDADDGRVVVRVGEIYDLDAIIIKGGDRRVGAACGGEGVHAR